MNESRHLKGAEEIKAYLDEEDIHLDYDASKWLYREIEVRKHLPYLQPVVRVLLKYEKRLSDGYDNYLGYSDDDDGPWEELASVARELYFAAQRGMRKDKRVKFAD